jgi:hypothetical protein
MTSELSTVERLTDQEAEVLRSWLGGNEVRAVARAKRLDERYVAQMIDRLCNYNRDVARLALDTGVRPATARPAGPPPPPKPAAALPEAYPVREPRTGNGRPHPADPVEAQRVQRVVDEVLLDHSPAVTAVINAARTLDTALRQPGITWYQAPWAQMTNLMRALAILDQAPDREPPTEPTISVQPGRVDQLLTRADRSTLPRVKAAATKLRALADNLAVDLEQAEAEDRIRSLVEKRRHALDEAQAQLRALTGKPASRPTVEPRTPQTRVRTSTIRAWAVQSGLDVNPAGVLPTRVVDAYYAAHPQASR